MIMRYEPLIKRGWLDGAWNFEAYDEARSKELGTTVDVPGSFLNLK
jgi:hypothetical protein